MIRDIAIGSIVGVAMLVSVCAAQADQRQPASGQASAPKTAAPPNPDEALVNARKAWSNGDAKQLEAAARHIPRDHLLADYPPYWRMSLRLRGPASVAQAEELDTDVSRMLARHEGSAIAEMLRRDWLLNLGRRGEWQKFDAQLARYSRRDDVQVNCLAWSAPNPRSQPTRAELEQVLMAPRDLPDTCNLLLEQVVRQQRLGADAAMRRLHRALEAGSISAIRVAADLLGIEPGALQGALAKPPTDAAFKGRREVALIALSQLARTDPKAAAQRLEAGVSGLTSADQVFAWSQIAAGGMRRMAPESLAWTQRAAKATVSDDTLNWMTRAALRDQNWPLVATLIDRMSDAGRDDPAWIYWRARALRNEGRLADSDWLLRRIADGFHFYGQLAAEDLGRLTVIPPQAPSPSDAEIAAHSRNAGFRRALKFYELGLRVEGNREWNHQLPAMSDRELLAAAAWACSINVLDRCVNTADRTQRDHDFALRFVTPFREQVKRASGERNIDPAWVYGLIRQESRFIMDARSVAGAQGLMQIMPATGRWIAQKLEVPNFRVELLSDRDTNIRFGTFYLKNVLDDLDGSPVLASAGYNAGPGRPRNWRSTLSGPVEGAIFAEIIPFHETRDYVKKVLSNATFYASLFTGQPQSLRSWLGQVGPQPAGSTTLP
jgi:soluble lytic murein transglycosylase